MIYLDNAATSGRKPIKVILSALWEMLHPANAGRGGHKASMRTAIKIERTRECIRNRFFDGNVIFTKNCTEALNLAIVGSRPKGQVIATVFDHNSVLRPLKRLEKEGKISLTILRPEQGGFEKPLERALQKETSLVVMTAKSNVTGEKTDVEKLASIAKSKSNALFCVDLAQSAGEDVFSYDNIDMIASAGHKGLYGLQGTGFLLCKKNVRLFPLITGGTGTSGLSLETPLDIPEGMEAGTINAVGIISLYYGIEYVFENRERIKVRSEQAAEFLRERLKKTDNVIVYPSYGNVVVCNVKGKDSATVADILSDKYGICVRGGLHCAPLMHTYLGTANTGAIRFSFGKGNTLLDAVWAAKAMERIARSEE